MKYALRLDPFCQPHVDYDSGVYTPDYTLRVIRDSLCSLVIRISGYRSRGPGFNSRHYQIFWEVVGLERGTLSLASTIEELLERKSNGSV
jgi:hypothetical protein